MEELPIGKKIILFDGVCNLCDSTVQYIIKRDNDDIFRFASLQSDIGQRILKHIGVDAQSLNSVILYEPKVAYFTKSNAVMEISKSLGGAFSLLTIFRIVPKFLRDPFYDLIAKNRYKWYGIKSACMIPDQKIQAKFL
ncbi:MAG TPA: thiol-disulfide oxidoreductase DCC family protein [Flavobacterium sp.]